MESTSQASEDTPAVAIVGSGPAGFYLAEALLAGVGNALRVHVYEKLPAPYGLVRYGVAPDHEKIKSVTRVFERVGANPRVSFLGNVEVGADVGLDELLERYQQVALCTGCEKSRRLGIAGEEAEGSHAAASFVAWYNGHPEYADYRVQLTSSSAVVVGVGDVALDVTRMLLQPPSVLAATDCSERALRVFRDGGVRQVHLLSRRGPAQARFSDKELAGVAAVEGVRIETDTELVRRAREAEGSPGVRRKLDHLLSLVEAGERAGGDKRVRLHFLRSPRELLVRDGAVAGVRLDENRLVEDEKGVRAEAAGRQSELSAGLFFCSVGYQGTELSGAPFDARRGIVPNAGGRVVGAGGEVVPRLYAAGWIKRGPSGVIGTNKADARETAAAMLADGFSHRARPGLPSVAELLEQRGVRPIGWEQWQRLDALERERGRASGRPRVKFEGARESFAALD